jgi:hypothetical protein
VAGSGQHLIIDAIAAPGARGELFPLDQLESRLKCPRCGARRAIFDVSPAKSLAGEIKDRKIKVSNRGQPRARGGSSAIHSGVDRWLAQPR